MNPTSKMTSSPSTSKTAENYSLQSPSSCEKQLLNKSLDSATSGSKRGRPKSEILSVLMIHGATSPSSIKCKFCNRVFPRDKSLSAHLRTHTGERPYICDFPMCNRAFTQSGQLKTHQRLHTGERPFSCSAPNCQMRFTHANRHCPDHPYEALKRNEDDFVFNPQPEEQSIEILKWLQKYREERQQMLLQQQTQSSPQTSRKTPKRPSSSFSCSSSKSSEENNKRRVFGKSIIDQGLENNCDTNIRKMSSNMLSPNKTARNNKGLIMCEMDLNVQSSTPIHQQQVQHDASEFASVLASPISTNKQKYCRPKVILWKEPIDAIDEDENTTINNENENVDNKVVNTTVTSFSSSSSSSSSPVKKLLNPKKKWLREAWQEQDLARPLDFGENHPLFKSDRNWQISSSPSTSIFDNNSSLSTTTLNPNQNRPSVLVMTKDKTE